MALLSEKTREAFLGPLNKNNPVVVQILGICSALAVTVQLKPALVMGIVVGVVFWIPYRLLPNVFDRYLMSAVLTMIAVLIGVIVYAVVYTKSTGMTDAEIRQLPMGTKILVLLRKLHVR